MAAHVTIDEQNLKEEISPLSEVERGFADKALQALPEEQRRKLSENDIITTVRGYQTYTPREEETIKAFQAICNWRDEVGYYNFLKARLDNDEQFHHLWPETLYGEDKYGHLTVGIRVNTIDTEKLLEMNQDHLIVLQGQKMASITEYKKAHAAKRSEQRYKHTLIVDMEGMGMSLLSGTKRHFLQRIFAVSGNFFPESVWKIYVVNAPFMFRAAWAVVKPWIHPVTTAKVNIFGSPKDAIKKMIENGLLADQVPEWAGGHHKGIPCFELLKNTIDSHHAQLAAAAAIPPHAPAVVHDSV